MPRERQFEFSRVIYCTEGKLLNPFVASATIEFKYRKKIWQKSVSVVPNLGKINSAFLFY
jgi:hypothetical protein